jgi:uncharacterized protein YkvS
MKVGDLVRLRDGSMGVIVEIEPNNRWVVLHCGEKFSRSDLEVVND